MLSPDLWQQQALTQCTFILSGQALMHVNNKINTSKKIAGHSDTQLLPYHVGAWNRGILSSMPTWAMRFCLQKRIKKRCEIYPRILLASGTVLFFIVHACFPKPLDEPGLLSSYLFKNSQIACSIYDCALPLSGTYFKTWRKFSFCIAEIWITFFWLDCIAEAGR